MKRNILLALAALAALALGLGSLLAWQESRLENPLHEAQRLAPFVPAPFARAPAAPLRNAYFGELHLHTSVSLDSNIFDTRNGPRRAYRFARGEEIELPGSGARQRLAVPLDFAAVTDHAEGLGAIHQCYERDSGSYWTLECLGVRHQFLPLFPLLFAEVRQDGTTLASYNEGICGAGADLCRAGSMSVWRDNQAAAEEYYEPGRFTTFNGFEYSPTLRDSGMLHRNVIFRGSAVPASVFSAQDGFAEDLLRWLDRRCTGACQALSIPHNPNFSWGLMFGDSNSDGTPLTRENLALRARYETLVEIFQAKGSSECAAGVGNNDEECGFEQLWPACGTSQAGVDAVTGQHAPRCVAANDLVRNVLRRGLAARERWGFNPYRLGIVAATDNHNGAPGDTAESGWNGHGGVNDATPEQRLGIRRGMVGRTLGFSPAVINPGGLSGVWAEENTREAIWDALKRRETFGTSGTRLRVRLFGGFGFAEDLHLHADAIATAYASGVPMGGELSGAAGTAALSLLVWALADPQSAPLQRIQVVKGWLRGDETLERVYDVACSDGIAPDPVTHRCADNGATVDIRDCGISREHGAAQLSSTWTDPDFDPAQPAFYYARVLENPVCRFSQRDALRLGVEHPPNVPATIQERAWSSPVWYEPIHLRP